MRVTHWLPLICFAISVSIFGQSPPASELPKNPRDVFSLAAPLYNFSDPSLKPWHLKATYQLYDDAGKPTSQGTYEYWWVSPTVYRSTWMRGESTHTDWHTSDGKHLYLFKGQGPEFFEYRLQSDILSPLPDPSEYDPATTYLDREMVNAGTNKVPCIMIVPKMPPHGQILTVPLGMFPTYCFDSRLPILIMRTSFGSLTVNYGKIVRVQDRFVPKQIEESEARRRILMATVDTIEGLSPNDPALTPPPDARSTSIAPATVPSGVMQGNRIKGQNPIYPQDAKAVRAQGKVVLKALIGRDGKIHDLKVTSAPYPSLVASAMWAVSQWEYKPYLLNGEPVDVETEVNVIYSLGN
jgi:TonB family protein